MRMRAVCLLAVAAVGLVLTPALASSATAAPVGTVPASGTFSFSLANGILPTWASEDIIIVGVSPGTVTTATSNLTARVSVPIIAKTGSANAAAGGFRLYNSRTGMNVRCSNPTIDTRARVVDCVLPTGKNAALFNIKSIASRARVLGQSTITWIYRGIVLGINGQEMADMLNSALSTTSFSPYVNVGSGDLIVTRDR
jgi:hypothetical protein